MAGISDNQKKFSGRSKTIIAPAPFERLFPRSIDCLSVSSFYGSEDLGSRLKGAFYGRPYRSQFSGTSQRLQLCSGTESRLVTKRSMGGILRCFGFHRDCAWRAGLWDSERLPRRFPWDFVRTSERRHTRISFLVSGMALLRSRLRRDTSAFAMRATARRVGGQPSS